ncbi:MAG TPA: hypothetical protein VFN01_06200 [Marinobacter sp.]|uniref:hypothetical protein n=1 Tax=Marinobacter sp. TaxID=50741 RepID=UPI002D8013DE|nr:hypothetical protein [Marinobacter sp.]HET8800760.1 hypothetical protein [Marinobacter sp.]
MNPTSTQPELPPRAGRSELFPSGRLTFLAPRPLPTGLPPVDHGHAVGEVNGGYLDFGAGATSVFGWQATLGGPFFCFLFTAFGVPALAFVLFYWLGNGWPDGIHALQGVFDITLWLGFWGGLFGFFILSLPRWQAYAKLKNVIPTRFNRQRRRFSR